MEGRLSAALRFQHTDAGRALIERSMARTRVQRNRAARKRFLNPKHRSRSYLQHKLIKALFSKRDNSTPFGCSSDQLKEHFKNLFRGSMGWDNYGALWEIDHVCAVCRFAEAELLSAFHYTNLRPRIVALNRIDGRHIQTMKGAIRPDPYAAFMRS